MSTFSYHQSAELFERATRVIPTGIPGNLSPKWFTEPASHPTYAAHGRGARFTDVDGNELIDYVCGFGPNILGYSHDAVNQAVIAQIGNGTTLSRPTPNSIELAEELVDLVSIADWATFCKSGTDVTALATLVARAATGRKTMILINGGYHGTLSWMQTVDLPGITSNDVANVIWIDWNDLDALRAVVAEHKGDVAGFMAAPYWMPINGDDVLPADGYWAGVREICDQEGIVLIMDDVRCGFRIDLRGSNEHFGFEPDLICFSKAIANGFPLSALVGTDALREAVSDVLAIGTFWFESSGIAAGLATVRELKRSAAADTTIAKGNRFAEVMHEAASAQGYELAITGIPSLPSMRIVGDDDPALTLSNLWTAECTRRGAYFIAFHNHFLTTAHTEEDFVRTGEIAYAAFGALQGARSELDATKTAA